MGILPASCSATWQCALLLTSSHIWAVTFDWLPAHSRGGWGSEEQQPYSWRLVILPPPFSSEIWLLSLGCGPIGKQLFGLVLFLPTSSRLAEWNAARRLKAFSQTPHRQPRVQQTKVNNNNNNNIETFYVSNLHRLKDNLFFHGAVPETISFLIRSLLRSARCFIRLIISGNRKSNSDMLCLLLSEASSPSGRGLTPSLSKTNKKPHWDYLAAS